MGVSPWYLRHDTIGAMKWRHELDAPVVPSGLSFLCFRRPWALAHGYHLSPLSWLLQQLRSSSPSVVSMQGVKPTPGPITTTPATCYPLLTREQESHS